MYRPLLLILLCSACSKDTEENNVKKVVTNVRQVAEKEKINAVLDHISKNYRTRKATTTTSSRGS